jgi:hypothetical protein
MNKKLTEQIAYHIFANLGVLPSNFVDQEVTRSIIDKQFLLSEKITFNTEDGGTLRKNIYGCQVTIANSKALKILIANCTEDETLPEFCALVQLEDAPVFGMYLIFTGQSKEKIDPEAFIAVSTDKTNWMPCSTYLQATFLAGMEQIRDLGFGWSKCTDYQDQYQQLLLFIKFHHSFYGVTDEGQES